MMFFRELIGRNVLSAIVVFCPNDNFLSNLSTADFNQSRTGHRVLGNVVSFHFGWYPASAVTSPKGKKCTRLTLFFFFFAS